MLGAEAGDFLLQLVGAMLGQILRLDARGRAIGVDGREMARLHQRALEGQAPVAEARHGERAQRVAVPAALARDEAPTGGLAPGAVVLERDLEAGLHRLRPAGYEDHALQAAARPAAPADDFGQLLQGIAGEDVAVAMGDAVELGLDRRVDFLVAMAKAEHRRAARAVDIASPVGVEEIAAFAIGDLGQPGGLPGRLGQGGHEEVLSNPVSAYSGAAPARQPPGARESLRSCPTGLAKA